MQKYGIWRFIGIIYKIHCLHHFNKGQSNGYLPYFCSDSLCKSPFYSMKERNRTYSTLYVDLDGTLLKTDILWEQIIILLRSPIHIVGAIVSMCKGKTAFKRYCLINAGIPDISTLPIHAEVIRYIANQHQQGIRIVLATASLLEVAIEIQKHFPFIDECLGSTDLINLKGERKSAAIVDHAQGFPFGYIGNDHSDFPIWNRAQEVIYVGSSSSITSRLLRDYPLVTIIDPGESSGLIDLFKEMRIYQWIKNILVFIPALLAHVMNFEVCSSLLLTFVSFGLLASSVYVLNDLFDLQADRMHSGKCHRPLASGRMSIPSGITLYVILLLGSIFATIIFLPLNVGIVLAIYLALTTFYSVYGKKIAILDVMLLAGLYTMRLIAGALTVNVVLSEWLMGFSMFFFLSLAFVKRYSEVRTRNDGIEQLPGRGYEAKDSIMLLATGLASAMISILVLALYINSDAVVKLYTNPSFLWLICPAMLTWLLQMWFIAHRGKMHDDPIISMAKTPVTYFVLILISCTIWFAT